MYSMTTLNELVNGNSMTKQFVTSIGTSATGIRNMVGNQFNKDVSIIVTNAITSGKFINAYSDEDMKKLFIELACDTIEAYNKKLDEWKSNNPGMPAKVAFARDYVKSRFVDSDDLGKSLSEKLGEFMKDNEEDAEIESDLEKAGLTKDTEEMARILLFIAVASVLRQVASIVISSTKEETVSDDENTLTGDVVDTDGKVIKARVSLSDTVKKNKSNKDDNTKEESKDDENNSGENSEKQNLKIPGVEDFFDKESLENIKSLLKTMSTEGVFTTDSADKLMDDIVKAIKPAIEKAAPMVNKIQIPESSFYSILSSILPDKHVETIAGINLDKLIYIMTLSCPSFDDLSYDDRCKVVTTAIITTTTLITILKIIDGGKLGNMFNGDYKLMTKLDNSKSEIDEYTLEVIFKEMDKLKVNPENKFAILSTSGVFGRCILSQMVKHVAA